MVAACPLLVAYRRTAGMQRLAGGDLASARAIAASGPYCQSSNDLYDLWSAVGTARFGETARRAASVHRPGAGIDARSRGQSAGLERIPAAGNRNGADQ